MQRQRASGSRSSCQSPHGRGRWVGTAGHTGTGTTVPEIPQPAGWQDRHRTPGDSKARTACPRAPRTGPGTRGAPAAGWVNYVLLRGGIPCVGICSSHKHLVNASGARAPRSSSQVTSEASCTGICSLQDFPWSRVPDSGPGFPLLAPQAQGSRACSGEHGGAAPANAPALQFRLRPLGHRPLPVPAHSRSPETRLPQTGTFLPCLRCQKEEEKTRTQAAYAFCGGRLRILLPSGWLTPQMYNESGTCTLIKNDKRSSH